MNRNTDLGRRRPIGIGALITLLSGWAILTGALPAEADGMIRQELTLAPGWNSIYVEAQPEPRSPEAVFSACPVESVWHFADRESSVQFLVDPAEGLRNQPGWRGWFSPTVAADRSELTNLFAIHANRSYLVRLSGGDACTVSIDGRPGNRAPRWVPDAFTLTGFPVEEGNGPTFAHYFAQSPAHLGQPIYELSPQGVWEAVVAAAEPIDRGEAYWVHTSGASDFAGPIRIASSFGDGLDFTDVLERSDLTVTLAAPVATPLTLTVEPSVSGEAQPTVVYRHLVTESFPQFVWEEIPPGGLPLDGDDLVRRIQLGIRRMDMGPESRSAIVTVSDGGGTQWRLPLTVDSSEAAAGFEGLWVGNVVVEQVNQLNAPRRDLSFDLELGGRREVPGAGGVGLDEIEDRLVASRSEWRFNQFDGASVPPTWSDPAFDDAGWSLGSGEFGFGDTPEGATETIESTVLPPADVYYFRNRFVLPSAATPSDYEQMVLRLLVDDGASVFLNGVEVARTNLPNALGSALTSTERPLVIRTGDDEFSFGEVSFPLEAGEEIDPAEFLQVTAASPASLLLPFPAENVIAVALYQHDLETAGAPDVSPPTPVKDPFRFRVLMHVDSAGQVRLLKQVIRMWENGTTAPDPDNPGFNRTAQPGRYVLVTKDSEIDRFSGSTIRDGEPVGVRVSTAAYDFNDASADFDGGASGTDALFMTGAFDPAAGTTLQAQIVVPRDLPTNPFRHRKHPDHDDVDDTGAALGESNAEVYAVDRTMTFTFVNIDPNGSRGADGEPDGDMSRVSPGWLSDQVAGVFQETVVGIHRDPVIATGTFQLERASRIEELNQ